MESSQIVTMHIQSVDQNKAIKSIKHTITELDRSKIEEQKKAVRSGYDMDIIPSDLATYGKDAKALLKELQSQNERMFLLTFLVMNAQHWTIRDGIADQIAAAQIKDGREIELLPKQAELCHIGDPFLVRPVRMEIPFQQVWCDFPHFSLVGMVFLHPDTAN